jgi:phenylalanyl-tRNA synthetase alpha chain
MYKSFDDMFPVVSCTANFDEILIPADHVSRSANDTYYVSADKVLRCHTSAHQAELLRTKQPAFLVTGGCAGGGRLGTVCSGRVFGLAVGACFV